jgi:ubiquitin-protein ligase
MFETPKIKIKNKIGLINKKTYNKNMVEIDYNSWKKTLSLKSICLSIT